MLVWCLVPRNLMENPGMSNTTNPILESLELALRVEGAVTPQQVALASGMPYRRVLEVLDDNKDIIIWGDFPPNGLIKGTRIDEKHQRRMHTLLKQEKTFRREQDTVLLSTQLDMGVPCRRVRTIHGSLQRIPSTPENISKLTEKGLQDEATLAHRREDFWKE